MGIEITEENEDFVWIKAGAGESWHELVMHCVANGWGGIENLSLIPGNCGAAPMQNIGAYGVELKDVFQSLEALDLEDGKLETFSKKECKFGYRTSIFKTTHKGLYLITSITLKLCKNPKLNTSYGAIEEELNKMNCTSPTIQDVSKAVISIRNSKLPNPAEIGNAGSFFKNPEISVEHFEALKAQYKDIPGYIIDKKHIKVPAGWLIEKAGLKGKKIGNYGVHEKQALVLVNYGGAKGSDILELSETIIDSVYHNFGIELEREVNIY
jgi:UDP-N-acetylmuramate dehydrogenase